MSPSFFESYLWVWTFLFQIPMGAMSIILIHDLTGGSWGESARGELQKMVGTFWFFPLFFIPLIFGLKDLYPWISNPEHVWRASFYTPVSYSLRSLVYFVLLAFISKFVLSSERSKNKSALCLCLYILTMSFITTDWLMVREPEWHSTIFGLILILSSAMTSYAVFLCLQKQTLSKVNRDHASMFLIFILVWCYLAFMQYLIVWSGNLPKEAIYYIVRFKNGWQWPILLVTLGNFFIPFFLLLHKSIKINGVRLGQIAMLILVCRGIDMAWVLIPATRADLSVGVFDFLIPAILMSTWYQFFKRARTA